MYSFVFFLCILMCPLIGKNGKIHTQLVDYLQSSNLYEKRQSECD